VRNTFDKFYCALSQLPSRYPDKDRLRRAAESIGLSLSAFVRQAVLEEAVDVGRRMGP
jgi:hypothetical protein